VTLIRLVWLIAGILMLPFWLIGYIVAWIVVPDQPEMVMIMPAGAPVTQQQS
jgi:phage shock protein PspC (stress-responsive transcriptional regulator)